MDGYGLLRRVLFGLPPDRAHDLARLALRSPVPFRWLGRSGPPDPRLATVLAGIPLPNPIGLAPGFDKDGDLLPGLQHLGFGYLVIGSLTPEPRAGNPRPRLVRYPDRLSIANSMGLPNQGVDAAVRRLRSRPITPTVVIASVAGFSVESILASVSALEPVAAAVEVGLICPNTSESERLRELELVAGLVAELARRRQKPVFVKLPPYHVAEERQRVLAMVEHCVAAGIDGVSLNGGRQVVEPRLAVGQGSLAGRETFADALRIVREVADHAAGRLAIRASGGVFTGDDAATMLRAGADTVEVYSSFIYRGWRIAEHINRRLLDILTDGGVGSVQQLGRVARAGAEGGQRSGR
jgi:dihydroorotate dehydrogenase